MDGIDGVNGLDGSTGEPGLNGQDGADGSDGVDGQDGKDIEFIFRLAEQESDMSAPQGTNIDDYVPFGWSDDQQGVSANYPYEYVSKRVKVSGVWGGFSVPTLWSRYSFDGQDGADGADGADGRDGKDIEFIFKQQSVESPPLKPDSINVDDYVPDGWSDDQQGVSSTYRFEYVCKRIKSDGVWGEFSQPTLWARYALDGADADTTALDYLQDVFTGTFDDLDNGICLAGFVGVKDSDDLITSGITDGSGGLPFLFAGQDTPYDNAEEFVSNINNEASLTIYTDGKIVTRSNLFMIKDESNNDIAVFTEINGQPILKSQFISVDDLTVKYIETPEDTVGIRFSSSDNSIELTDDDGNIVVELSAESSVDDCRGMYGQVGLRVGNMNLSQSDTTCVTTQMTDKKVQITANTNRALVCPTSSEVCGFSASDTNTPFDIIHVVNDTSDLDGKLSLGAYVDVRSWIDDDAANILGLYVKGGVYVEPNSAEANNNRYSNILSGLLSFCKVDGADGTIQKKWVHATLDSDEWSGSSLLVGSDMVNYFIYHDIGHTNYSVFSTPMCADFLTLMNLRIESNYFLFSAMRSLTDSNSAPEFNFMVIDNNSFWR